MMTILRGSDLRTKEREREMQFRNFLGMAGLVLVFTVALYFGITQSPTADLNQDGRIDMLDMSILLQQMK